MLSQSRYQDAPQKESLRFESRDSSNTIIFNPRNENEFRTISMLENATCVALFANAKDPMMSYLFQLLSQICDRNHKLIVVDVGLIPSLGITFGVTGPKIAKIHKCQIVDVFQKNLSLDNLRTFVHPPSHVRWRK